MVVVCGECECGVEWQDVCVYRSGTTGANAFPEAVWSVLSKSLLARILHSTHSVVHELLGVICVFVFFGCYRHVILRMDNSCVPLLLLLFC